MGVVVNVDLPSAVRHGRMKILSDDGVGVSSCFRSFLLTALNLPPFTGKIRYIAEKKLVSLDQKIPGSRQNKQGTKKDLLASQRSIDLITADRKYKTPTLYVM